MNIYKYPEKSQWSLLTSRPKESTEDLRPLCETVFETVKAEGDAALKRYTEKFDKVSLDTFRIDEDAYKKADAALPQDLKKAIRMAAKNIERFHRLQKPSAYQTETAKGVWCRRDSRPIEKVGLYIPGGTAPLFSTVLMLAIPAKLAGCSEIVMVSPPDDKGEIHPAILFAAQLTGITQTYKIGGIQGIAALSLGTESIPQVYKLFGPGNRFVTAAKQTALQYGTASDLPAGPSELLVIADSSAKPAYVAADLLSQAEHGYDSQVLLLTNDKALPEAVLSEINQQLVGLARKNYAEASLKNSRIVILETLDACLDFSNMYAPEHLIIATEKPAESAKKIMNAGSVFLGPYSCESLGDYSSGTNHTLPTGGFARSYSGVSVESFCKQITFQTITREGLKNIGPATELMAEAEQLQAHRNAVTIRLNDIQ